MKNCLLFVLLIGMFACTSSVKQPETLPLNISNVTLELKWKTDTLLTTCESVIYDSARKAVYVSNIVGAPDAKDGQGFISKLKPTGEIETLRWVDGIDAPKGMGIFGNKLYVTNINEIIEIDIEKAMIANRFVVDSAKFLNDITVAKNGDVYVSDMQKSQILKLSSGQVAVWMEGDALAYVNGLFAEESRMLVGHGANGGQLSSIDWATQAITPLVDSIGFFDGVEAAPQGSYLVSEWNGRVYVVLGNEQKLLLDTREQKLNTADIGFIPGQNLLLVPTFFGNHVAAYEVKF